MNIYQSIGFALLMALSASIIVYAIIDSIKSKKKR